MRNVLIALAALSASGAAEALAAEPTTLRLTAEAQAHVSPDHAVIQAGVSNEAPTAAQAMAANARQMTEVIRAIRRSGVAERDLQTSNISLEPQYAYVEGQSRA